MCRVVCWCFDAIHSHSVFCLHFCSPRLLRCAVCLTVCRVVLFYVVICSVLCFTAICFASCCFVPCGYLMCCVSCVMLYSNVLCAVLCCVLSVLCCDVLCCHVLPAVLCSLSVLLAAWPFVPRPPRRLPGPLKHAPSDNVPVRRPHTRLYTHGRHSAQTAP